MSKTVILHCVECQDELELHEVREDGRCNDCCNAYWKGMLEERARIIQYLIEKEVLRESMFGKTWVALHQYEAHGVDLDSELGG